MKHVALIFMSLLVASILVASPLAAQTLPGGFRAAYVEGNVVAEDTGKPLAGAKVDVIGVAVKKHGVKAESGCGAGFALSAANGDFAVGVGWNNLCASKKHPIDGKYYVSISKRGYLPQQRFVDFGTQRANLVGALIFRLIPAHATVQGQVMGPGGKGLAYAYVFLMKNPFATAMHPPKGHVQVLSSEAPMIRTDANGKFTIPVSPGDYMVMAAKQGYQLTTKTTNPFAQQMYGNLAANPYMSAQLRAKLQQLNQPQLGVFVHVVDAGTASADLAMARVTTQQPVQPVMMKQAAFAPYKVVLAGDPRLTPNNVLFFTSQALGGSLQGPAELGIMRSRNLLGAGKVNPFAAHVKTFNFELYGFPGRVGCQHRPGHASRYYCEDGVFSFTDPTAKPGVAYYYYVFEEKPPQIVAGRPLNLEQAGSPYSNAVQILTH